MDIYVDMCDWGSEAPTSFSRPFVHRNRVTGHCAIECFIQVKVGNFFFFFFEIQYFKLSCMVFKFFFSDEIQYEAVNFLIDLLIINLWMWMHPSRPLCMYVSYHISSDVLINIHNLCVD